MKNRFNLKLIIMFWVGFLTSSFHCQVMAQDKPVNSLNNSVIKSGLTSENIIDDKTNIDTTNDKKDVDEIKNIIIKLEDEWNNHNLNEVMNYYSDSYVNNDGLDKAAITELTKDFWKTYPDVQSNSKIFEIRLQGDFATVESLDKAIGHTAKEMPGLGSKGILSSKSEGALYIKRTGKIWKIIGDRNNYEEVKVSFGIAKLLNTEFTAPEQVKSGSPYSAKLNLVSLPPNIGAVGSITSEPLKYPQGPPVDSWRPVLGSKLERIMNANNDNRNELIVATIGLTDPTKGNLAGLAFITRRLNVIPEIRSEDMVKLKKSTDEKSLLSKESVKDKSLDSDKAADAKTDTDAKNDAKAKNDANAKINKIPVDKETDKDKNSSN